MCNCKNSHNHKNNQNHKNYKNLTSWVIQVIGVLKVLRVLTVIPDVLPDIKERQLFIGERNVKETRVDNCKFDVLQPLKNWQKKAKNSPISILISVVIINIRCFFAFFSCSNCFQRSFIKGFLNLKRAVFFGIVEHNIKLDQKWGLV